MCDSIEQATEERCKLRRRRDTVVIQELFEREGYEGEFEDELAAGLLKGGKKGDHIFVRCEPQEAGFAEGVVGWGHVGRSG